MSDEPEVTTIDALPIPPRPSVAQEELIQSVNFSHATQRPALELPIEPHPDWEFNHFLQKLENQMTEEDVSRAKTLFAGDGGIPKAVLEKIKTGREMFRILKQYNYLSRYNLLYLQSALFCVGRKDLVQEAVKYAQEQDDVLHCYSTSYQPENGYRYVRFHIGGRDFSAYNTDKLKDLRRVVSKILVVPEMYVLIAGIEPTASIVITFLIPLIYVEILAEMLRDNIGTSFLAEIGVDYVDIADDNQYPVKGIDVKSEETKEVKELSYLRKELTKANKLLEKTELHLLELEHQLEAANDKLTEIEFEKKSIEKVWRLMSDKKSPATLQQMAALNDFTRLLTDFSKTGVDKTLISRLIDSTVTIMVVNIKEANKIQFEQMRLQIKDMQSKFVPLMFENARFEFITTVNKMREVQLSPLAIETCRKISQELKSQEKEKLKKKYTWATEGKTERFMQEDDLNFMAGLLMKEIETTGILVDFVVFMEQSLTDVGREDLKKHLTRPNNEQQHVQRIFQEQFNFMEAPKSAAPGGQSVPEENRLLLNMAQQVQEMHKLITAKESYFGPKLDNWNTAGFPPKLVHRKPPGFWPKSGYWNPPEFPSKQGDHGFPSAKSAFDPMAVEEMQT